MRAEPIATLYERGQFHHVGVFPQLEEQQVTWTPDANWSPDRLDAMVWGATILSTRSRGYASVA
jgi:phage terminase large subunit-like protein